MVLLLLFAATAAAVAAVVVIGRSVGLPGGGGETGRNGGVVFEAEEEGALAQRGRLKGAEMQVGGGFAGAAAVGDEVVQELVHVEVVLHGEVDACKDCWGWPLENAVGDENK